MSAGRTNLDQWMERPPAEAESRTELFICPAIGCVCAIVTLLSAGNLCTCNDRDQSYLAAISLSTPSFGLYLRCPTYRLAGKHRGARRPASPPARGARGRPGRRRRAPQEDRPSDGRTGARAASPCDERPRAKCNPPAGTPRPRRRRAHPRRSAPMSCTWRHRHASRRRSRAAPGGRLRAVRPVIRRRARPRAAPAFPAAGRRGALPGARRRQEPLLHSGASGTEATRRGTSAGDRAARPSADPGGGIRGPAGTPAHPLHT